MPIHNATLGRVRLYALNSFDGFDVSNAQVLASGALAWDRRFALVDAQGVLVNGKRNPGVHAVRISWVFEQGRLGFAAEAVGSRIRGPLPEDARRLQGWLGERLARAVDLREEPAGGFPDDTEAHGPTVVASASIERVAAWFNEPLETTRRRFRCNLEVGGVPAFWEDGLLGAAGKAPCRLRIGAVELLAMKPSRRCPVPTRDPDTGEADSALPHLFSARREAELPAWAPRDRFEGFYRTRLAPGVEPARLACEDGVTVSAQ